jgi:protein-S-isoprenylcysteine O-methyltransferase Ste14
MAFEFKVIVFVLASAGITWVSRASLIDFRSHGFYRFFAWEAILALILLNLDYWFYTPFRIHQLISWLLLIICTYLVIQGFRLLGVADKSQSQRSEPGLMEFEKTTELVTVGTYRYIRHPLYSSLLFLAWGAFFKHPSWASIALVLIATIFLTMTAKVEEAENIRFFGPAYQSYMKQSKMFIPYLF